MSGIDCIDRDAHGVSGLELAITYALHVDEFAEAVDRLHRRVMA